MRLPSAKKLQQAIDRLKQGAGLIPLWARNYSVKRLEGALAILAKRKRRKVFLKPKWRDCEERGCHSYAVMKSDFCMEHGGQ